MQVGGTVHKDNKTVQVGETGIAKTHNFNRTSTPSFKKFIPLALLSILLFASCKNSPSAVRIAQHEAYMAGLDAEKKKKIEIISHETQYHEFMKDLDTNDFQSLADTTKLRRLYEECFVHAFKGNVKKDDYISTIKGKWVSIGSYNLVMQHIEDIKRLCKQWFPEQTNNKKELTYVK